MFSYFFNKSSTDQTITHLQNNIQDLTKKLVKSQTELNKEKQFNIDLNTKLLQFDKILDKKTTDTNTLLDNLGEQLLDLQMKNENLNNKCEEKNDQILNLLAIIEDKQETESTQMIDEMKLLIVELLIVEKQKQSDLHKKENSDLKSIIISRDEEIDKLNTQLQENEQPSNNDKMDELNKLIHEKDEQILNLLASLKTQTSDEESQSIHELKQLINEKCVRINELLQTQEEIEYHSSNVISEKEKEIDLLFMENKKLDTTIQDLENELSNVISEKDKEIDQLEIENKRLNKTILDLEDEMDLINDEYNKLHKQFSHIQSSNEKKEKNEKNIVDMYESKLLKLEEDSENINDNNIKLENDIQKLNESISEKDETIEKLNKSIHDFCESLDNINGKITQIDEINIDELILHILNRNSYYLLPDSQEYKFYKRGIVEYIKRTKEILND